MNSIIYYNNKYPQDYGILYMDTPESDLLSIDKLTDYKKGIRMYGLISCIGVFILPNPNTLIGGHFVDERDIDFLTKMDNIIMNDCSAASAKSGDLDLGEAGRRAVEEAASVGGDTIGIPSANSFLQFLCKPQYFPNLTCLSHLNFVLLFIHIHPNTVRAPWFDVVDAGFREVDFVEAGRRAVDTAGRFSDHSFLQFLCNPQYLPNLTGLLHLTLVVLFIHIHLSIYI